jgi:hypothetical protein
VLAVKVQISTTLHDSGICIIHYIHSLIGLKDIHVSKRDVDNRFQDIFNGNQSLMLEGDDLNRLRDEACYLMGNIHQKYLSFESTMITFMTSLTRFNLNQTSLMTMLPTAAPK